MSKFNDVVMRITTPSKTGGGKMSPLELHRGDIAIAVSGNGVVVFVFTTNPDSPHSSQDALCAIKGRSLIMRVFENRLAPNWISRHVNAFAHMVDEYKAPRGRRKAA